MAMAAFSTLNGIVMAASDIHQAVGSIQDPELGKSLADLKMVKQVQLQDDTASVAIELPTPAYPEASRAALTEAVTSAAKAAGIENVTVDFSAVVRGKNSGQKVGLSVKNVIAVGSGKGGVGKSTVAASLAYGLKHFGAKVGLLDADVYGPSIPHLVGASGQPQMIQRQGPDGKVYERIEPLEADGIKLMSMGFMIGEDQAVIWRGPMLHKALTQFMQQTEWGELDYLIVDMPPGTGDVALTLSQMVSLAGAVVVCTPQQVALLDAGKAITMFGQVKIPVLGVVENMTGEMFGRGGAKAKAESMNVSFLGEVPAQPIIREQGDAGAISKLYSEDNPARDALLSMTSRVAIEVARQVSQGPAMPQLEIL